MAFAATAGVAELDAHCLMDNPHKGGHDCYFDRFGKVQLFPPSSLCLPLISRTGEPRASYHNYALLARVIRGGYRVSGGGPALTNISGAESGLQIIAAAGDSDGRSAQPGSFTLGAEAGVVASSGGVAVGGERRVELGVGDWIVTQHEPTPAWGK